MFLGENDTNHYPSKRVMPNPSKPSPHKGPMVGVGCEQFKTICAVLSKTFCDGDDDDDDDGDNYNNASDDDTDDDTKDGRKCNPYVSRSADAGKAIMGRVWATEGRV